jgi:hypothetical protein
LGTGAPASSSIQTAVRTVDLPLDASPTSAQSFCGCSSTVRAPRKQWIDTRSRRATPKVYPFRVASTAARASRSNGFFRYR